LEGGIKTKKKKVKGALRRHGRFYEKSTGSGGYEILSPHRGNPSPLARKKRGGKNGRVKNGE